MFRTQEEERVNAYSHLISSVLCILAFITLRLTTDTVIKQDLILLLLFSFPAWTFFSSFLYHNSTNIDAKIQNRSVDKVGIYLMIMSSGLCFTLTSNNSLFIFVNSLIIIGLSTALILRLCVTGDTSESFSLSSYIIMGWFCIFPVTGLLTETNFSEERQMIFLVTGSCFYLCGVIFYVLDRIKWFHGMWHLASFLGFIFHGLSIIHAAKII